MDETDARRALERVLRADAFRNSERGSTLLAHIVETFLAGRVDDLNGNALAQDVFGRDETFDASTDPIVRVQVSRIRSMLASYYHGQGQDDPVVISIPRGTYTPTFEYRTPPAATPVSEAPAPARRRWPLAGVAVAVVLLAIVFGVLLWSHTHDEPPPVAGASGYPRVAVLPFENLTGDPRNGVFSVSVQRQIAAGIDRAQNFEVMVAAPAQSAQQLEQSDYILSGVILSLAPQIDVIVRLADLNAEASPVITSRRIALDASGIAYADAIRNLSARIVSQLTEPEAELHDRELERIAKVEDGSASERLDAYRCIVMADELAAVRRSDDFEATYSCLRDALATRPDDGNLLAALAWLTVLGAPEADEIRVADSDRFSLPQALQLAEKAVKVDPGNDRAFGRLAAIQWLTGKDTAALESNEIAMRLNPDDTTHLARTAIFQALRGNWDASLGLARDAKAQRPDRPGWYDVPFFLRALTEGDGDEALKLLPTMRRAGGPRYPIYALATAQLAGDTDLVERLRPDVEAYAADHGGDALYGVRIWARSPEIIDMIARQLTAAGISAPSD